MAFLNEKGLELLVQKILDLPAPEVSLDLINTDITIQKSSPHLYLQNSNGGNDILGIRWEGSSTGNNTFGIYDKKNNKNLITIAQKDGTVTFHKALSISNGGTGATTAPQALKNLGLTATATQLNYMSGVVENVQIQIDRISGDIGDIVGEALEITGAASTVVASNLAANRVVISNANGKIAASSATTTELGYLSGVTGNIQTQLNGKSPTTHTHTAAEIGAVSKEGGTTGKLYMGNGSSVLGNGYTSYGFRTAEEELRGALMIADTNRIMINQQETGVNYAERYLMPEIATGLTKDVWYNILTTKNPVTVAQGGTGATTAAAARENIGALSVGGGTITGELILDQGSAQKAFVAKRTVDGTIYTTDMMVSSNGAGIIRLLNAGTEKNRMTLREDETAFIKPVSLASGGTGASTAANARANLGAVNIAGDTMTGTLAVPQLKINMNSTTYNVFSATRDSKDSLFVQQTPTSGMLQIGMKHPDASNSEWYRFPTPAADLTEAKTYYVLTSKAAVTIAQGGTGATTAAGARSNLGITPANIGAASLTTDNTFTGKNTMGTVVMTSAKVYAASWPSYMLGPDATTNTGSLYQAISSHRVGISQKAEGSTESENYLFPVPSVITSQAWYNILTTKTVKVSASQPSSPVDGMIWLQLAS